MTHQSLFMIPKKYSWEKKNNMRGINFFIKTQEVANRIEVYLTTDK